MRCACPEVPYFRVSGQILFTQMIINLPHNFVKPKVKRHVFCMYTECTGCRFSWLFPFLWFSREGRTGSLEGGHISLHSYKLLPWNSTQTSSYQGKCSFMSLIPILVAYRSYVICETSTLVSKNYHYNVCTSSQGRTHHTCVSNFGQKGVYVY